jgi:YesN/AraC family two-component response regulator
MARVLVIDDEELARFTLREVLQTAGHEVAEATNGNEGITLQKAQPFDLIITDIIMPKKEGVETIIELKKDFPDLKIIGISGGGRTRNLDFLKLAKQFGAEKVLAKPFTEDELLESVNACLT